MKRLFIATALALLAAGCDNSTPANIFSSSTFNSALVATKQNCQDDFEKWKETNTGNYNGGSMRA